MGREVSRRRLLKVQVGFFCCPIFLTSLNTGFIYMLWVQNPFAMHMQRPGLGAYCFTISFVVPLD